METVTATTITVSEELKRELLKVAAQLQASKGEKIDYEDVLRYLIQRVTRNLDLFHQACSPTGVSSRQLRQQLKKGRREDRERDLNFEHRNA